MNSLTSPITQWALGIVATLVAGVLAMLALPRLRAFVARAGWPLATVTVLGLLALAFYLQWRVPPSERYAQTGLPAFLRGGYWLWLALAAIVTGASVVAFIRWRRAARASHSQVATGEPDDSAPRVDAAWEEIRVLLDAAGVPLGSQSIYVVLAPDEERAEGLTRASGVQLFAKAPKGPAPIHAYAMGDGLLLSVSGASGFGAGDSSALEALGRKLRALDPDCPPVRGVILLLPIDWAGQAEAVEQVAAVRDDLQAIQRSLNLRCPVFALFTGMEGVPGLPDFIARMVSRMSPQMADQRVGFSVPRAEPFSGDLVQRGLVWMSGWFHNWILGLLAADPLDAEGNARLVSLDYEFRRYRKRLRALLESALSSPVGAEPVLFRGCYFVATGERPEDRAFAAGLLRGPKSRILADHVVTDWGEEAMHEDRKLTRVALLIGGVGILIGLAGWIAIVNRNGLGWVGALALAGIWAVGLFWMRRP